MKTTSESRSVCSSWNGILLAVLCVVLAGPLLAAAETAIGPVTVTEEGDRIEVRFSISFSHDALRLSSAGRFDRIDYAGLGSLTEAHKPRLPARTLRIALPEKMAAAGVRVDGMAGRALPGDYLVEPAPMPRPLNGVALGPPTVRPDPSIYDSAAPFPEEVVSFLGQCDLAGQTMASIRICPLQYSPASGTLNFLSAIDVTIYGERGTECGDLLPANISARGRAYYERQLSGMVANPDDVVMRSGRRPTAGAGRGVDPGRYDYVIITQWDWVDDFQPLADWRTRKGTPATIVTNAWIYNNGGYGGSNLDKIRAFVEDAHATWGAHSFLLGGDTGVIPFHTRTITVPGYGTDSIANDTYLADFDDDWVLEVDVARAPVRDTGMIDTFVDKILAYEKNPPPTNYVTTGAFFGFDNATPGDAYGEMSKELVRGHHYPANWTLSTEYDSEAGLHKADVIGYLNQGHHLVNHHDHCNQDIMGVGYISHGELLYNNDVNALTNGDYQSIVFAVGCYPAYFPNVTSIGEAFVRNSSGGAVAFMGNTCIGWGGSLGGPNEYTTKQDEYFYRNLFDDGFERLGANFTDFKNDVYEPNDPYNLQEYVFTEMHLLGDPELEIWTADPAGLSAQHDPSLIQGTSVQFAVTVTETGGGAPLENATVTVWKAGDVYEVDTTDPAGAVVFSITPATAGDMSVTVTKHNYIPYESVVEIVPTAPVPDIKIDGQDGPMTVYSTQTVNVTISLLAADQVGVPHDWWIVARGFNRYWWTYPGKWTQSVTAVRAYNGPLVDLTDYPIAQGTLATGQWSLGFAVDALNNTFEATYWDIIYVQSY